MINSMTGYGGAEGQFGGVTYVIEVKTVNNRYFKVRTRLPEPVAFLEEDIEKLLRESLSRGMVNYVLGLKDVSEEGFFEINEKALQGYIEKLGGIAASADVNCRVDIGGLLSLPGMLVPILPEEDRAGQIRDVVLSITREALGRLKEMRASEGAALAADLEEHCNVIRRCLEQLRHRSDVVLREYQKKLKGRVDALLKDVELKLDEDTLAREVAVFAERSDISEELARLDSHLQQFAESCESDSQVGRRLDFISQEMLREVNTIASKSADTEITNLVLDMKCRIDRIKEQVQNVE